MKNFDSAFQKPIRYRLSHRGNREDRRNRKERKKILQTFEASYLGIIITKNNQKVKTKIMEYSEKKIFFF